MADDWMLEGSEQRLLSDCIDQEDNSWGQSSAFKRLKCPVCGCTYQHSERAQEISGDDSYDAGWSGRGDLTVIPVWGECGHLWQICFGYHKGETAAFVRVALDPEGNPKRSES